MDHGLEASRRLGVHGGAQPRMVSTNCSTNVHELPNPATASAVGEVIARCMPAAGDDRCTAVARNGCAGVAYRDRFVDQSSSIKCAAWLWMTDSARK